MVKLTPDDFKQIALSAPRRADAIAAKAMGWEHVASLCLALAAAGLLEETTDGE